MSDAAVEIIKKTQHIADEANLVNTSVSCG